MNAADQDELFELPEEEESDGSTFEDFSRDVIDVLVFVAVQWEPVSMSTAADGLPRTGLKNEADRRFTVSQVKDALQELESKGWLARHNQGRMVTEGRRPRILAAAFGDPNYLPRAKAIADWALEELSGRYYHYGYANPLRDQVRLELLLYVGRDEEALKLLEPSLGNARGFEGSLAFLVNDFDPGRFAEMPVRIRALAASEYLEDVTYVLGSPEPAWRALADVPAGPGLVALSGTVHFLRGEEAEVHERIDELRELAPALKAIDEILERETLADARALEACLDFARGKIDGAIDGFEESVKIEKGPTRKKKFCPRWIGGLIFQLALCRRGEAADLPRVQIGKWMAELEPSNFRGYASFGETIADCVAGDTRQVLLNATYQNAHFLGNDPPNLNSLLFAIFFRLAGAGKPEVGVWEKQIGELAELASERGYGWLAMEAAAFCSLVRDNAANRKRLKALTADSGIEDAVPFSDKLAAPEPWEAQLKAMEAVAEKHGKMANSGAGAKMKGTARKELIWHLRIVRDDDMEMDPPPYSPFGAEDDWDLHDEFGDSGDDETFYISLTPIERSVSKTGRTTKGRAVSLKKLKEKPDSIVSLTDQDRAVARFIRVQRDWSGRAIYTLKELRALVELAGHPLLFADAEATRPLTLTRGRIRVDVSDDEKSRVTVRLVPPIFTEDNGAKLIEEGPDRYRIFEIPKAVSELAAAFDDQPELSLPAEAKPRLMNAISTLAGDLEIGAESDSGDGGESVQFRQTEGDSTPRLRLVPEGAGLRATMRVRPIATSDFTFAPGGGKTAIFGFDGDDRIQAKRDLAVEQERAEVVIDSCPTLSRHRGESPDPWEWELDSPLSSLELLRDLHGFSEACNGGDDAPPVILEWPEGESIRLTGVVSAAHASVALGGTADWLTLSGEVAVNEDLVFSMRKLLDFSAASTRPGFVEIGEGQFVALTEEFQRQIDDLRALSQPGKGETIKLPPLAALALEDFVEDAQPAKGKKKTRAKLWRDWIERFRESREHRPDPPADLHAELRPYQLDGYRWLSRLAKTGAGACLADDMGLGKTVQALALLLERAELGPSLVVAPTSVAANWIDETVKFAPTLNPVVFGDSGDRTAQLAALRPRDLVVCTYGLLPRETEALGDVEWNVIVLDEAQAIKNSATQRSKAARKLNGAFRVVTTGTPVENRLSELHTLFQFLLPGFLGSWDRFRKQFADPIERDRDPAARAHLRRLIQPFLLRRLKSAVLKDLPERTEINLHVDLGDEEMAFYEALRRRAVEDLEDSEGEKKTGAIQILAELTRLRRACCHPVLVDKKAGATMGSAKLAAFSETLDELLAGGHKVLVFSQFVDHLSLVRAELEKQKVAYQYLDGSTSKPKRKQAVDAFQRGEGEVFLISLKAGGFGLNLTAADYVIHMDPWWNPAAEDQASDRAHRIGQTRPVTIYRLITCGTIEEKIVELHHRKRELADSLLSDSADAEARLSPDELLALIRG